MRMGRNGGMERSFFDQTDPTGKSGPPFFETFPVGPNRSNKFWTEKIKSPEILAEWIAPSKDPHIRTQNFRDQAEQVLTFQDNFDKSG